MSILHKGKGVGLPSALLQEGLCITENPQGSRLLGYPAPCFPLQGDPSWYSNITLELDCCLGKDVTTRETAV